MRIKLQNDYHGTEVQINLTDGRLSQRQLARADHELCGCTGCCCGGLRRNYPELGILYDSIRHDSAHDSVAVESEDLSYYSHGIRIA